MYRIRITIFSFYDSLSANDDILVEGEQKRRRQIKNTPCPLPLARSPKKVRIFRLIRRNRHFLKKKKTLIFFAPSSSRSEGRILISSRFGQIFSSF